MFLWKHVLYTLAFIVIWSVTLTGAYSSLYDSLDTPVLNSNEKFITLPNGRVTKVEIVWDGDKDIIKLSFIDWISFIASLSTGLLLGLIWTREPYFNYRIKKTIYILFGQVYDKK